jgi:hypothetical protein
MSKDDDYKIGYRKPPKHSQFKKGQSGNPRGRRKAPNSLDFLALLRKSMTKKVKVRVGGDIAYFSKIEAGAEQVANKLASGDLRTIKMVLPMLAKLNEFDRYERDAEGRSEAHRKLAEMLGLEWKPEDEKD